MTTLFWHKVFVFKQQSFFTLLRLW